MWWGLCACVYECVCVAIHSIALLGSREPESPTAGAVLVKGTCIELPTLTPGYPEVGISGQAGDGPH